MSDSEGNQYSRHVKVYQYARHLKATDMTDMRNALLMKYIKNKHVFDTVGNNVLRTQRYIRTTCFGGIQPKSIQYRSLTLLFSLSTHAMDNQWLRKKQKWSERDAINSSSCTRARLLLCRNVIRTFISQPFWRAVFAFRLIKHRKQHHHRTVAEKVR